MMEAEGGKVLQWKAKGVWKRREGWGGGNGERRQGMIPEGCHRCSKISPHHSTNQDAA